MLLAFFFDVLPHFQPFSMEAMRLSFFFELPRLKPFSMEAMRRSFSVAMFLSDVHSPIDMGAVLQQELEDSFFLGVKLGLCIFFVVVLPHQCWGWW